MKFKKYKSIPKTYQQKTVEYFTPYVKDITCQVTEKVHGTNFSFIVTKNDVKYAQRSGIVDGIFNSQNYVHLLLDKVKALREFLGKDFQLVTEFYGKGITGKPYIDYTETKKFIAFDLRLIEEDVYLDQDQFQKVMKQFDIPFTPVLFEGSFEECLKFDPNFESKVAEKEGVEAEGIVIKPIKDIYVDEEKQQRIILKLTSDAFRENKLSSAERKAVEAKLRESKEQVKQREAVTSRITDMRISKVAAKNGIDITEGLKVTGKLLHLVAEDIQEEVKAEEGKEIDKGFIISVIAHQVKNYLTSQS